MANLDSRDLRLRQVAFRSKRQAFFGQAKQSRSRTRLVQECHLTFTERARETRNTNTATPPGTSIQSKDASSLKKITALAATLAIALSAHQAAAQEEAERERRIEVVGFGGVGFTGDLGVSSDTQAGNVSFDSAPVYGGTLGFKAQRHGYAYFSYSRMQTTAYFRPDGGFDTTRQTDVAFDYFQVGGNLEAPQGRVVPYLGLSIGATRLAPVNGSGNDFSFSGVLDGGVKIMLTPFLDVRLIGRMPLSFISGEAAAFCAGGACAFRYSGQPLLQGQGLLGVALHL